MSLEKLKMTLFKDFERLGIPAKPWVLPQKALPQTHFDVVVIGAGMAGLAASFALIREGISNIKVYDQCPAGKEGPWATYAHMRTLRSGKSLAGPALDLPNLTFQAWFEAQFGHEAWENLYKIPTLQWMDYLRWYRNVLDLPVENYTNVVSIEPENGVVRLITECVGQKRVVLTRKAVLATGRLGFGGAVLPEFVDNLPHGLFAHTAEQIDFSKLKGKHVGVIGVGASSFDAAATALEAGASEVTIMSRRDHIGNVNKLASTTYPGFALGYRDLSDQEKILTMRHAWEEGAVPPFESLMRIEDFPNLRLLESFKIERAESKNQKIHIYSNHGHFVFDFLIVGTGFAVDGSKQPELKTIYPSIKLWKDQVKQINPKNLGLFPYLGDHFQFLEKKEGSAPYLKHIYCYNFAASLSQGQLSGDIPNISTGATRLAKGIVSDFFAEDWDSYYHQLEDYNNLEFVEEDYPFINKQ